MLNPNEFPNTPLPVKGGLSKEEVLELLYWAKGSQSMVGLGLYEYSPCGKKSEFIQSIFDVMLK